MKSRIFILVLKIFTIIAIVAFLGVSGTFAIKKMLHPINFAGELDGVMVNVSAKAGAFPENTQMKLSSVSEIDVAESVKSRLPNDTVVDDILAVDISFYVDSKEIQPQNPADVRVEIKTLDGVEGDSFALYHIGDDGVAEEVSDADINETSVRFDSMGFSVYAIIGVDGHQNDDKVRRVYHFMQWDDNNSQWQETETQIVKNGDSLIAPNDPHSDMAQHFMGDDRQFQGWVNTGRVPSMQEENISDGVLQKFGMVTDIDETAEDEEEYVYASFKPAYKAAFFDIGKNETGGIPGVVAVLISTDYAEDEPVDVSKVAENVQTQEGKAVTRWYIYDVDGDPYSIPSIAADDKTSLKFSEIKQTIFLYPEITDSHAIVFDKNDSTTNAEDKDTKTNASFTNSVKVAEGVTVNKPADPTRDGYTFGGWYESRDCTGDPVDFSTKTYSSDTTLYAKWIPNEVNFRVILWTETFDEGIGKSPETRPGQYYSFAQTETGVEPAGTTIENMEDAERIFGKLFTEAQIKNWFPYHENPDLSDIDGDLFIAGDGSTILDVYFDLKTYTLTFNVNNGATEGTIVHMGDQAGTYHGVQYTISVKIGQDISRLWPIAAEVQDIKTGYNTQVFKGWTRSGANSLFVTKRDKMVKELLSTSGDSYVDTTFTANYDTNLQKDYVQYYLQKADGDGYELSDVYTEYINANRGSSVQPKEIEGFTFERNGQNNGDYDSNLQAYVYAFYYNRNQSSIEFINYGEIDKEVDNILHGADISDQYYVPQRPAALEDYYSFDGWYLDQFFQARFDDGSFEGKTMHKDNLALYAKWKKDNASIIFDGNGGTIDGEDSKEYSIEADTKLVEIPNNPIRGDNWEFLGWYDEKGDALDPNKPFVVDTTFRAKWKSLEKFSIKYAVPEDEAGRVREDMYLYYDGAMTAINRFDDDNPQSRNGYNFIGWQYETDPDGRIYHENEMFEVDADRADSNNVVWMEAVYDTETPIFTTLVFNGNGGNHQGLETEEVNAIVTQYGNIQNNEWQTLPSDFFAYTDKKFVEWNTRADGSGVAFPPGKSIGVDAGSVPNVLYAIWENDVPEKADYKVKHYKEIVSQDEYNTDTDVLWGGIWYRISDTDTKQGEIGAEVTASQKLYQGFHLNTDSVQTGVVTRPSDPDDEDGMLALELYYDRNEYEILYRYDGFVPSGIYPTQAAIDDGTVDWNSYNNKYGTSVSNIKTAADVNIDKTGYTFDGWYDGATDEKVNYTEIFSMPDRNLDFYGMFTPNIDTKYYIEHWIESVDQDNPSVGAAQIGGVWYEKDNNATEEKSGTTDSSVEASPKTEGEYMHYIYNDEDSVADGTIIGDPDAPLTLTLLYRREKINIYYEYVGFVPVDAVPSQVALDSDPSLALYGETFDSYRESSSTIAGEYTFDGWYFDKDCTEPAIPREVTESFTVYGKFVPRADIPYDINIYYQKNGEYSEVPDEVISKTGTTGEIVYVDDEYLLPDDEHRNQNYQIDLEHSTISGTLPRNNGEPLRVYFRQEFTLNYLKGDYGSFVDINDGEDEAVGKTYFPNIDYGTLGSAVAYEGERNAKGDPVSKDGAVFAGWAADVDVVLKNGEVIFAGDGITEDIIKAIVIDGDINLTAIWDYIGSSGQEDLDGDGDASENEDIAVPNSGGDSQMGDEFINVVIFNMLGAIIASFFTVFFLYREKINKEKQ